jgi:hypothetical protein
MSYGGPSGRIEVLREKNDSCQVSAVAWPEMSKAGPEGTEATVVTFEGSLTKREATDLEATLKGTEAVVEQQELKRMVVRRRLWPKERSQDSVGPRPKLSASGKRLICRAVPALRNLRKGPDGDSIGRGNLKVRTFWRKQRTHWEYNSAIKGRGEREQTRQRMRRTSDRTAMKTVRLESERPIVRSAVGLSEMNDSAFW